MKSWGNFPSLKNQKLVSTKSCNFSDKAKHLAIGLSRSYGDVCLNEDGVLLSNSENSKFISFDAQTGILKAESGVTISEIIKVFLPKGWFPPVVPGTKFVTLGGAIANDIHGKNHHISGTFGNHVKSFALKKSTGEEVICSEKNNKEMFSATISGLGLTGVIVWAEIQLKKVKSSHIDMKSIKFKNLDEFFSLSEAHDKNFEYTVAWLDCVSSGKNFGRGIYMAGNHSENKTNLKASFIEKIPNVLRTVPFFFPSFILNKYTIRIFNALYYNKQFSREINVPIGIDPFFFPLDAVFNWNKIYGKNGFFQFQCVVPESKSKECMKELLKIAVDSGQASFLAVIKKFGNKKSPGLLSFPRRGTTICMDFPNAGKDSVSLMKKLEEVTMNADGALYPAKDALMSELSFKKCFPNWSKFKKYIDPVFSSSFWRRVSGE